MKHLWWDRTNYYRVVSRLKVNEFGSLSQLISDSQTRKHSLEWHTTLIKLLFASSNENFYESKTKIFWFYQSSYLLSSFVPTPPTLVQSIPIRLVVACGFYVLSAYLKWNIFTINWRDVEIVFCCFFFGNANGRLYNDVLFWQIDTSISNAFNVEMNDTKIIMSTTQTQLSFSVEFSEQFFLLVGVVTLFQFVIVFEWKNNIFN